MVHGDQLIKINFDAPKLTDDKAKRRNENQCAETDDLRETHEHDCTPSASFDRMRWTRLAMFASFAISAVPRATPLAMVV